MKYTKEQLQAMSDFEVNKALAIAQGIYAGDVGDWMPNGVKVNDESGFFYIEVDYCKRPNDIMPLAFEYGVTVKCVSCPAGSGFAHYAESYGGDIFTDYTKPCRAAAICLILVLQGESK